MLCFSCFECDDERVVIGAGCHGAASEVLTISDRLKAPLIHSVKGQDIMPDDEPHWIGGIGMIDTKASYHAVTKCDLFLMLGTALGQTNGIQALDRARQVIALGGDGGFIC